jgi:hypothetical protein
MTIPLHQGTEGRDTSAPNAGTRPVRVSPQRSHPARLFRVRAFRSASVLPSAGHYANAVPCCLMPNG